jgi:hypothetical protein
MKVSDFQNNPAALKALITAYTKMEEVIEGPCADKFNDSDFEYYDGQACRAMCLLSLELAYPNKSWSKLEFAIGDDSAPFLPVADIPMDQHGVLRVCDSAGKYTQWWF